MKWIILIIAMVSASANSEDKLAEAIRKANREKADFIVEQIIEARQENRDVNNIATEEIPKKSLKDCIKPNNVIDDEVKRCMDGE